MTENERQELIIQSMEKNKKGCATQNALKAQKKLYDDAHPFHGVGGYKDMSVVAYGENNTDDNW